MPLFSKSKNPKAPEWAGPLSREEFDVLREMLLKASDGDLDAAKADGDGQLINGEWSVSLRALAAGCNDLRFDRWEHELERWVKIFRHAQEVEVMRYPQDIGRVRLQLYTPDILNEAGDNCICREDIPGLLTTLVVTWPDHVIATFSDYNDRGWMGHKDEVFDRLTADLAAGKPHAVEYEDLPKHKDVMVAKLVSNDSRATTHALVLEQLYPQLVGSHGALVALPFQTMAFVKRLDAEPTKKMVKGMRALVDSYEPDDYSLTDDVYLYKDGKYTVLE